MEKRRPLTLIAVGSPGTFFLLPGVHYERGHNFEYQAIRCVTQTLTSQQPHEVGSTSPLCRGGRAETEKPQLPTATHRGSRTGLTSAAHPLGPQPQRKAPKSHVPAWDCKHTCLHSAKPYSRPGYRMVATYLLVSDNWEKWGLALRTSSTGQDHTLWSLLRGYRSEWGECQPWPMALL